MANIPFIARALSRLGLRSSLMQAELTRSRPRIGLTGSFGRGNYGDELYVRNYQHWLAPWADLFLLTGLPKPSYFSELGEASVNLMDSVVLGGGDLLCPYRPKIDRDFINPIFLRRPLHVAGIGVERNRSDIDPMVLQRWTDFLTHPSIRSITTRDPGSKSWIEEHVRPSVPVNVHPDMICALPLPPAKRPEGPPIVGLVTRHIKHPKEYILVAEVAQRLSDQGWRVRHIIGGVGSHGSKDLDNSRHLKVSKKETFHSENLDAISQALGECSLVLSMKLHTTLVAVMYGVPTVCVNPVVKAKAFMDTAGCSNLVVAPNNRRLIELVDAGVPPPPPDRVDALRNEASAAMRALAQRLWDDFRNATPAHQSLPTQPKLPR